ncbi:MAG: dCMP deaminase family protein [Candidatus Zixiibacteriota bacterium]|nr:MAG: dCMP deaminase family protein [candidate division Zixibacteria bacterium]
MAEPLTWEEYFMMLALAASLKSKDPSTQVGAVIIDNRTRKLVSSGYNGSPRYIDDKQIPQIRPDKYLYVVHAELNAILHAQRELSNCSLYATVFPCSECMKAIIQSGIKRVVYLNELNGTDWTDSRKATMKMAELAGVKIDKFESDNEIIKYLNSCISFRKP